jgi:hypothetical protein
LTQLASTDTPLGGGSAAAKPRRWRQMGYFQLNWRKLRQLVGGRSAASIRLDQPADALWIAGGGERQSFDSVRDAVRFVMDQLAPAERASAWIRTHDGFLDARQIEQLYGDDSSATPISRAAKPECPHCGNASHQQSIIDARASCVNWWVVAQRPR